MQLNRPSRLVDLELFSDLILDMSEINGPNELRMYVHKSFLYLSCNYFENLIIGYRESQSSIIPIKVPNVFAAYDIIMSLYGKSTNRGELPEWLHLLEKIKCLDFWNLDYIAECDKLNGLVVPPEDFDTALDIISSLTFHKSVVNSVAKFFVTNLPKKYDLKKIPKELMHMVIESVEYSNIIYSENFARMWNTVSTSKEYFPNQIIYDYVYDVCILPTGDKIAIDNRKDMNDQFRTIDILDIDHKLLSSISIDVYLNLYSKIHCSPNGKYIVCIAVEEKLIVLDVDAGKQIETLLCGNPTNCVCWSPDSTKIISGHNDCIAIFNFPSARHERPSIYAAIITDNNCSVDRICCSPNGEYIIWVDISGNIYFNNAKNYLVVRSLIRNIMSINSISYSPDNMRFVSAGVDGIIRVWDTNDYTLVYEIKTHSRVLSICYSSNSRQIVSGHADGCICVWNMRNGSLIKKYTNTKCFSVEFICCCDNANSKKISRMEKIIYESSVK